MRYKVIQFLMPETKEISVGFLINIKEFKSFKSAIKFYNEIKKDSFMIPSDDYYLYTHILKKWGNITEYKWSYYQYLDESQCYENKID